LLDFRCGDGPHPHAPLPERVATDIQTDINALHDQFIALVAGLRRIDPAVVRATEARVYRGKSALAAGLGDQIGCLREVLTALEQELILVSVQIETNYPRPCGKTA